jgi:hypothetical protein
MSPKRILIIVGVAALAGCGRQVELQPAPGHPLPVKPLMARTTPTVDDLLTPPSYTRPDTVLPTTMLFDANGREVWRYVGDLDWTSPEAAKLLAEAGGAPKRP